MTLEQLAELKRFVPYYQAGSLSSSYVAAHFGVTRQHALRLIKAVDEPRITRIAHNRLRDEIRDFIAQEKRENPHKNCQWIAEIASDRFGQMISRASVYRVLSGEDLLAQRPLNQKPRNRFEAEKTGDLIQMDTSCGDWAGGRRIYVTVLLDDYSRYILKGEFTWHDGLSHSLRMIRETAKEYGRFRLLYTDNASWFKAIRHDKSMYQKHSKEEYESEVTRACRELGITHLTHKPYEPQAKGKIERLFGFIQKRFVVAICDDWPLWKINVEFESWIDWYNTKHINRTTGATPEKRFDPAGFEPLSDEYNLDDIFCLKDTRKVDKCNQINYQGTQYTLETDLILGACKVNLCIIPERSIRVFYHNNFVCELPIVSKNNQLN